MQSPLLRRQRSRHGLGAGGAAGDQAPAPAANAAGSAATASEPAGPSAGGSAGELRPEHPHSRLQQHHPGSLINFPGDHFSFGEISGMGRSASAGGLLHADYFNRGKGLHEEERERLHLPALVESGRHAGRSRVEHRGAGLGYHLWTRDFFITVLETPFTLVGAGMALLYLLVFFWWGTIWYLVVRFYPSCLYGATTFVESWTFAIITQMTIGYGNTGPQRCWVAAWLICIQSISNLLLNAIVLGIIFAKVANPRYRGYSIYISDSAVIARRDGILKFMFRIADVRRTQVIEPRVQAFLYTWGAGRVTAEGEQIPVRCEALDIGYIDGMLLLPLIVEHNIDERSPLCGHTHDSLAAMNAEIVVTFEATTEMGNPFLARQSYLAQEINWGCQFHEIICKPAVGEAEPHYGVQLDSFHDVRCPAGPEGENQSQASQAVVNRAKRAVPYPVLGENTLVLADLLCVRPVAGGKGGEMELVCRVADTYPSQMLEVLARMYLYRWRPLEWCRAHPDLPSFTLHQLECGFNDGSDRLHLRLPEEVSHCIVPASPLASWLQAGGGGLSLDADSEIVVVLQGYLHQNGQNRMRSRTYRVGSHVRYGFTFAPAVRPPLESRDGKPRVRWSHFFDVEPVGWSEGGRGRPTVHFHSSALNHPAVQAYMQRQSTLAAPESHAQVRAQQDRNPLLNRALDTPAMRSPRWAEQAVASAPDRGFSWPRPVAAAPAGAAGAPSLSSTSNVALAAPVTDPALQQAADALGRDSTATPAATMDRYAAMLAQPSLVQGLGEEAAVETGSPTSRGSSSSGAGEAAMQPPGAARAPAGPPDLGTLSAGPAVGMDRYESALSRLSRLSAVPEGSASLARRSPFIAPAPGAQQAPGPAGAAAAGGTAAGGGGSYAGGEADTLSSDFTVTPSVPLERYAAMVAEESQAADAYLGGQLQLPGQKAERSADRVMPLGSRAGTPPAEEAATQGVRPLRPLRDASWHQGRSLANLQALFGGSGSDVDDGEEAVPPHGSAGS